MNCVSVSSAYIPNLRIGTAAVPQFYIKIYIYINYILTTVLLSIELPVSTQI